VLAQAEAREAMMASESDFDSVFIGSPTGTKSTRRATARFGAVPANVREFRRGKAEFEQLLRNGIEHLLKFEQCEFV